MLKAFCLCHLCLFTPTVYDTVLMSYCRKKIHGHEMCNFRASQFSVWTFPLFPQFVCSIIFICSRFKILYHSHKENEKVLMRDTQRYTKTNIFKVCYVNKRAFWGLATNTYVVQDRRPGYRCHHENLQLWRDQNF